MMTSRFAALAAALFCAAACGSKSTCTAGTDGCGKPVCTAGAACTSANPCHLAALVCSSTGPVCTDTGNVADGVACGGTSVCNAGACGVGITIQPKTASVPTGGAQNFSALVTGTSNNAVTYSVQGGPAQGTIDQSGVYTAPAAAGVYTVVVTSQADPSKSDSATVTASVPSVAPGKPQELQAVAGCRQIVLFWGSASDASSYIVKRSTSAQGAFSPIKPVITAVRTGWMATDTELIADHAQYFYQVFAHNPVADGPPATTSATSHLAAPVFVDPNGGATLLYAGATQISMAWAPYFAPGFTGTPTYSLSRSTSPSGTPATDVTGGAIAGISLTDTGLAPSTHYYYRLTVPIDATTQSCPALVDAVTGAAGSAIEQGPGPATVEYVSDTGSTSVPRDLSSVALNGSPYAFSVSGGTEFVYPGIGTADGRFTIPNVPAGYNYVATLVEAPLYTSAHRLDLSTVVFGRASAALPTSSTPLSTSASGLSAWNDKGDHLELDALGAGLSSTNLDQLPGASPPAPSATSASITGNFYFSQTPDQSLRLIDQQAGDVPLLLDLVLKTASPLSYLTPVKSCLAVFSPARMVDGALATDSCAMTDVAATGSVPLDWRRSQMHAIARSGVPTGVTPVDTGDSFDVVAVPDPSKHGAAGLNALEGTVASLVDDGRATDVAETVSYANPFPSPKWGLLYSVYTNVKYPVTAPPSSACPTPTPADLDFFYRQAGPLAELSAAVAPEVGAVVSVTVKTLAPSAGGAPVQIGWTAPAPVGGKVPTRYKATVYRVLADPSTSCKTTLLIDAAVWTDATQTSVTIRPEFLPTQDNSGTYFAQVRSFWLPDEPVDLSQPGRFFSSLRIASAFTMSATFPH